MTSLQDIFDFIDSPDDFDLIIDENGRESTVKFIDDYGLSCGSNAEFFLAGFEWGATVLVHARFYESAWESWVDESETIPEEELVEAYGIDDSPEMAAWKESHPCPAYFSKEWDAWLAAKQAQAKLILSQWDTDARDGLRSEYPELVEGYELQSNSSGTGIVDMGHYAWMREADLSQLTIKRKEKKEG